MKNAEAQSSLNLLAKESPNYHLDIIIAFFFIPSNKKASNCLLALNCIKVWEKLHFIRLIEPDCSIFFTGYNQ